MHYNGWKCYIASSWYSSKTDDEYDFTLSNSLSSEASDEEVILTSGQSLEMEVLLYHVKPTHLV